MVLVPFPFAELEAVKVRPALVVSSDLYHRTEPDVILLAITGNIEAARGPTDYLISGWKEAGLKRPSAVKCTPATIEPSLIRAVIGRLNAEEMKEVDEQLKKALGLEEPDSP